MQSAFTKDRHILNSVASTQEIIAASHLTQVDVVFVKLDFEKTFDSISWEFLTNMLRARGFGDRWIHLILTRLSSSSTSILVNGLRELI